MKSGQSSHAVIENNAPKGATHYYQNQWGVAYHFYKKLICGLFGLIVMPYKNIFDLESVVDVFQHGRNLYIKENST